MNQTWRDVDTGEPAPCPYINLGCRHPVGNCEGLCMHSHVRAGQAPQAQHDEQEAIADDEREIVLAALLILVILLIVAVGIGMLENFLGVTQ